MLIGDTYMYIENVSSEKDLVVTIDDNLNFSEHIALEVKKANQAIGMISLQHFHALEHKIIFTTIQEFCKTTS